MKKEMQYGNYLMAPHNGNPVVQPLPNHLHHQGYPMFMFHILFIYLSMGDLKKLPAA
jgi:hypothetical protein